MQDSKSLLKVCTDSYVISGPNSHTWERMPAIISIPLTSNAKEAEVEWFYEDLKDLLELTHTLQGTGMPK